MIASKVSRYMLKYQKAKAKLIEYEIEHVDYPNFPLNSNELSYSTVYVISRYVESIIENNDEDREEFFPHLEMASQYFDASVNSRDRTIHDLDFLLSGATAYFLSYDFGSAKVLCSKIENVEVDDIINPQSLLRLLYEYILLNKEIPTIKAEPLEEEILRSLVEFFKSGKVDKYFVDKLVGYRNYIYQQDNPISIYYVDILIAVSLLAKENSAWALLPKFSHSSVDAWGEYLQRKNAIKILWPSQYIIGEMGILSGENAIDDNYNDEKLLHEFILSALLIL